MTERHPWLHRYAIFVAFCTFLLVIAGALVTGNDAGLSVPAWPTSAAGQQGLSSTGIFDMPAMVGEARFGHGHRLVAGFVGMLTIILAIWIWARISRHWVRWAALAAVLAVVAQALLGGVTVLRYLPVAISTAHAALAQIFLCLASSLAFFTGANWRWEEAKQVDTSSPSLQHISSVATGAILVQLVLGAIYRHSRDASIIPHIAAACVVTLLVGWVVAGVIRRFAAQPGLAKPALLLAGLLLSQLFLGAGSYLMRLAARNAPQPLWAVAEITTTHVAVGAALLVTCLYVTFQTHRYLGVPRGELKVASTPHQATT